MTIGPAPMISIEWMSVRFAIELRGMRDEGGGMSRLRGFRLHPSALSVRFLHQNGKALEQVIDVVRSWARFRVALKTERRPVGQLEALQAAIEQRHVSNAGVLGQRRGIDSKTVVLASDHHAAGRK